MEFYVYEIDETIKAKKRPIIIITSNNEKSCRTPSCAAASSTTSPSPTAHPAENRRRALPGHQERPGQRSAGRVLRRAGAGPEEKPSTSELVDWLKLLMADNIEAVLRERDPTKAIPPLAGAW
jgi:hypothetical protein